MSLGFDRGQKTDQSCRCDALAAMTADVTRHFAATSRVSDEGCVLQIQRFHYGSEVIGASVHVIPDRRLTGSPLPAPANCNTAVAVSNEEQHLAVPGIGVEEPAVGERSGWAFAPVL